MANNDEVIRIEGLGKRYDLGEIHHDLLAEKMMAGLRGAASRVKLLLRRAAAGEAQKIEMTAPVLQQAASQEIEMTAPVLQTATEADQFEVAFIMPSEFTMDTLPKPNNEQVDLAEVPGRTMAVLSFSGTTPERVIVEKTDALLALLEADNVEVVSAPVLARFDPPWTLPHRRLNEVMVEVALSSTVE